MKRTLPPPALVALVLVPLALAAVGVSPRSSVRAKPKTPTRPALPKKKDDPPLGKRVYLPKNVDRSKIPAASLEAYLAYFDTLQGVQQSADAIVIGTPTQDFYDREHRAFYVEIETTKAHQLRYIDYEWTKGPFVIERVLYQKSGLRLSPRQTIALAEPVGIRIDELNNQWIRTGTENCFDLKKGSRYVVFVGALKDGDWGTFNYNLGRFNTDGTDTEDEVGIIGGMTPTDNPALKIPTPKQKLRRELTAAYGITLAPQPLPSMPANHRR